MEQADAADPAGKTAAALRDSARGRHRMRIAISGALALVVLVTAGLVGYAIGASRPLGDRVVAGSGKVLLGGGATDGRAFGVRLALSELRSTDMLTYGEWVRRRVAKDCPGFTDENWKVYALDEGRGAYVIHVNVLGRRPQVYHFNGSIAIARVDWATAEVTAPDPAVAGASSRWLHEFKSGDSP